MSDRDPNEAAKNWQIREINSSISNIKDDVSRINTRLDDKYATNKDVEQKIELIHAYYKPMKQNISKLLWVVVPIVVGLILSQIWALITNSQ